MSGTEVGSPDFIAGCVVLFTCSTLAAAGGIGGGALNVPILIAVFGYPYKQAVILSLCAVAGNVLSQVAVNFKKTHPLDKSRPLIYYDAGLILIPSQLGGNNVGVILAAVLPTTALMILAVVVILFAVYMTGKKGIHLYEVESAVKVKEEQSHATNVVVSSKTDPQSVEEAVAVAAEGERRENASDTSSASNTSIVKNVDPEGDISLKIHNFSKSENHTVHILDTDGERTSIAHYDITGDEKALLTVETYTEAEIREMTRSRAGSRTSRSSIASATGDLAAVLRTSFAQPPPPTGTTGTVSNPMVPALLPTSQAPPKTDGAEEDIEIVYPWGSIIALFVTLCFFIAVNTAMAEVAKCSDAYWMILALSYPALACIIYYSILDTSTRQMEDPDSILAGDLCFTEDKFLRPFTAFIIGITCSLLGIGGGELFGPFMLTMKIIPQVSSATTSLMSLVSSINNIVHHLVEGDLPFGAGGVLFGVGMTAGVVGRVGALYITKLFGRPSFLIFVLATILFASSCIMVTEMATEDPSFTITSACAQD